MEAASNKIILERLKEEWVQVADASVYRELELEKQLWMLTALRAINRVARIRDASRALRGSLQLGKMLSLYENHGKCSLCSFPSHTYTTSFDFLFIGFEPGEPNISHLRKSFVTQIISKCPPSCCTRTYITAVLCL
jgi:hypothetical protein